MIPIVADPVSAILRRGKRCATTSVLERVPKRVAASCDDDNNNNDTLYNKCSTVIADVTGLSADSIRIVLSYGWKCRYDSLPIYVGMYVDRGIKVDQWFHELADCGVEEPDNKWVRVHPPNPLALLKPEDVMAVCRTPLMALVSHRRDRSIKERVLVYRDGNWIPLEAQPQCHQIGWISQWGKNGVICQGEDADGKESMHLFEDGIWKAIYEAPTGACIICSLVVVDVLFLCISTVTEPGYVRETIICRVTRCPLRPYLFDSSWKAECPMMQNLKHVVRTGQSTFWMFGWEIRGRKSPAVLHNHHIEEYNCLTETRRVLDWHLPHGVQMIHASHYDELTGSFYIIYRTDLNEVTYYEMKPLLGREYTAASLKLQRIKTCNIWARRDADGTWTSWLLSYDDVNVIHLE